MHSDMHIKKVDFLTLVGTKFLDNIQCVIRKMKRKKIRKKKKRSKG